MLRYLTGFVLGAGVVWLMSGAVVTGPCQHATNPCAQVLVELAPYEDGQAVGVTVLLDSALVTFDPPSMTIWAQDDTVQVDVSQYEEVFIR